MKEELCKCNNYYTTICNWLLSDKKVKLWFCSVCFLRCFLGSFYFVIDIETLTCKQSPTGHLSMLNSMLLYKSVSC